MTPRNLKLRSVGLRAKLHGIVACVSVLMCAAISAAPASSDGSTRRGQGLLRWYQWRTVEAYQKFGRTNALWDKPVTEALELYSRMSADPRELTRPNYRTLFLSLSNAVQSGCDDPLVHWLDWNHGLGVRSEDRDTILDACIRAATGMEKSKYTTALKFEALIRPWTLYLEYHYADKDFTTAHRTEMNRCYGVAYQLATKLVKETNAPVKVVADVIMEMEGLLKSDPNGLKKFYDAVKNDLGKNWPDNARVFLFRGKFYVDWAWQARGTGGAGTVGETGWKLFAERLDSAETALENSWRLDPTLEKIPLEMMSVELGQGKGRERFELWFQRAMTQNTNNYDACSSKLVYLLPQWHGSARDLLGFGRECVASTNWGGSVAWTLVHAHEWLAGYLPDAEAKNAYWKDPRVWTDIKLACEKNLLTNLQGTNSARQAYIREARRCEQWDAVRQNLQLLTSTNFGYFGGRAEFDQMAKTAAEKVGKAR